MSGRGDLRLLAHVWPFLRAHRGLYALALVIAPLTALGSMAMPALLKVALDDYILMGDVAGTQKVALVYLAVALSSWLAEGAYTYFLSLAAMRTITDLRSKIYRHALSLGRSFFDKQPAGRLLTRATSDVEALGETLTAGAITIALDVFKVVGILAAMAWMDWRLTLLVLSLGPLIFGLVEMIRRVLRRLYLEVRTALAELNAFISERFTGITVVQLYADEMRTIERFRTRLVRYRSATIQTNIFDALLFAVMDGIRSITIALMIAYGSGSLFGAVVSAGLLAAFIDYVGRLYQPIQEFSQKVAVIQRAASAMEKIASLLEVEERVESGQAVLENPRGAIEVRDLQFSYGGAANVLKGVSLSVRPGEVVALVGRTGSGKTTIGRVLSRAYGGYEGSVTLDGVELDTLAVDTVRTAIGAVMQDVQLFAGDVRFNLTMGRPFDDERIMEIVRLVCADGVVEGLGGLSGRIAHQGNNLSVGEAQLLAIARTMLLDPPVVILDEATANVDSLTEALLQEASAAVFERKTVLVVAHRLSTIMGADRIYVLGDGLVLESGSHVELMRRGEVYADLFQQQFADVPLA